MVVSEGAINNIMGGMENTAGVRLHSHRHKLKQRFDIVRKLGQGTYGKVQLAINKETGQEVAIKTIKKAKIETEQDLIRIRREIQIMSSVQHPQIIHIYEVFENREKMVLVMEYAAGGELYDYLSERKVLAEQEARRVFRQVSSAVYYCHKHKICHRDLKLENILLDLDGNAKIADFGLSNVFEDKQRLDTFCGSPLYASPEIVKGVPYVGPEVDCWSLGVLLYTLVYGAMPFDGSNFRRLVKQITQGDFYEPATPATASELIRHMLTVQSTERANIEEICSHWWVNEGYSESCLSEAEALANQTPVRLDLLLSLAPKHINSEHMLIQPDDEDISQRSDSERLPPNLKIPPPPPPDEEATETAPLRSRSLGAVPPPGGVNVDMLIDKKEKRKKESSSKKPPTSRPPNEEEKKKKKEEKGEGDEKKKVVKKRDSSSEREKDKTKKREASTERERDRVKKRETSSDRIKTRDSSSERKKRDSSADRKKRDSSTERKKKDSASEAIKKSDSSSERLKTSESPSESKEVVKKTPAKKKESSLSRKSSTKEKNEDTIPSPTPSTDTLVGVPKSPSKTPVPESKPEPKYPSKSEPTTTTAEPKPSESMAKAEVEEKDTETILKETAAKIEKAEEFKEPVTSPVTSPSALSPVTSSQNSIPSSQATSPVRSRTGSESSTDQRPSRSESSSRRQSKIFSKAALFDPLLAGQGTKVSPGSSPVDKPKKVTRPGALNMSDLTKKFEEKPSAEKKNKVVAPFKVSDARKAFESKSDKSVSESPRRKASVGSSDSGPTSPKDSLSASPRDSLPTSPTRGDKAPVSSSSTPKTSSTEKVTRETSPAKKVSKSPSKDSSVSAVTQKRPKSPKKEVSPPKQVSKISSTTKLRDEAKEKPEEKVPKADSKSAITKKDPISRPCTTSSAKPASSKPQSSSIARADSTDSSDSESEAEKMLRELSEKREKLEMAKKEKMKKVSEGKEPQPASSRDMPAIREESQTPRPSPAPSTGAVSPQQETKEQKFATLPRGFKSKAETPKTLKAKTSLPRVNALEESYSGDSLRKKSQMEIVLNHNQQPSTRQPVQTSKPYDQSSKRSSFAEIHMNSPSVKEAPRPEFRTEVQHSVGTPERGAAPEPQLHRARRERIIPIMLEDDNSEITNEPKVVTTSSRSSVLQPSSSTSSKTSSVSSVPRSVGGFDGHSPLSATVGSSAAAERKHGTANASPEPIRKSRRERIIPIAVEGEGLMTPPVMENASTEKVRPFQRQGSSQGSFSRGRGFTLDRTESFSSAGEDEDDEEDDGFQTMTAESLFSTLLSRVRSLTRKMANDEGGRPGLDRLRRTPQSGSGLSSDSPLSGGASGPSSGFWSSLYSPPREIPGSRRVSESLSRGHSREEDTFGVFAPPLWGRSPSRDASDAESAFSESSSTFSTLPRADFLRHPFHSPHHRLFRDPFFSDFPRT